MRAGRDDRSRDSLIYVLPFLAAIALLSGTSNAHAHASHGTNAAWRACDGHKLDQECRYENEAHDVLEGTCRLISDALICVRNKPIKRHKATSDPI